jgi:predicted AAA+ superfamily ATPase
VLDINSEPLSLESILEHHEKSAVNTVESVEPAGAKILSLFKDYLRFGYFPYFLEYKDESIFYSMGEI